MCKISKETVCRANAKTKRIPIGERYVSDTQPSEIHLSVEYVGQVYTQVLTESQMRQAFGASLSFK